jgi:hypothetical protein
MFHFWKYTHLIFLSLVQQRTNYMWQNFEVHPLKSDFEVLLYSLHYFKVHIPVVYEIQTNIAVSQYNIIVRKNKGYVFCLNWLAIVRLNYKITVGVIFYNCISQLRSQPSQAKICVTYIIENIECLKCITWSPENLKKVQVTLVFTMGKTKCKFTDNIKSKYLCLRNGRNKWEAQCLVCKPGTYVSVVNKGALILEPTWNARGTQKLLQVKPVWQSKKFC